MNEPLTRSFMGKKIHPDFTITDDDTYCLEKDVKSAVEWLKEQTHLRLISKRHKSLTMQFWKIIDEAFPDLLTFPEEKETNSG